MGQLVSLLTLIVVTAILCTTVLSATHGDVASGLRWLDHLQRKLQRQEQYLQVQESSRTIALLGYW